MQDLTGQLLVAMPAMGDPRFQNAVIYICAHSEDGTLGLIVNKPLPDLSFADLAEQLDLENAARRDLRLYFGGPVEPQRGFVLHSMDYQCEGATIPVAAEIGMTATQDILEAIAAGGGPRDSLLALGYSGWGAGQLEDELAQNAWLTCPAERTLIFGRANEYKWSGALKQLGISPALLSEQAGHA